MQPVKALNQHVPLRVDCHSTDRERLERIGPCRAWRSAVEMVRDNGPACIGCVRMPFVVEKDSVA